MAKCGEKINIILFFNFNKPLEPLPVDTTKNWGDQQGQVKAPVTHQRTQVGHDISYKKKDSKREKNTETDKRPI